MKVNKNKTKANRLNFVELVHLFLDNYKEYPIYFLKTEILLILHCEEKLMVAKKKFIKKQITAYYRRQCNFV